MRIDEPSLNTRTRVFADLMRRREQGPTLLTRDLAPVLADLSESPNACILRPQRPTELPIYAYDYSLLHLEQLSPGERGRFRGVGHASSLSHSLADVNHCVK